MVWFCTVQQIENFLQLTIDTAHQEAVVQAITSASAAIQNYCHQYLAEVKDDKVIFDIEHKRYDLHLPELPVQSIKSVTEDDSVLVKDTDYQLGNKGVLYRLGKPWALGVQVIQVVYTHGFAGDVYPEDLVAVCVRAAARSYQAGLRVSALSGVPGVQSEALGDYSITYGSESSSSGEYSLGASGAPLLLRSEKEILDKYAI